MTATDRDDDIALAGEYALGLLEGEDRAAFEARMADDPALAREVAAWQERLASMTDEVDPVEPPARVWHGVQARLDGPRRTRRWLLWGGLAAGLAVVGGLALRPVLRAPGMATEIASADGALRVRVEVAGRGDRMTARILAGGARPGRSLELWVIAEGAAAPVSAGVLAADRTVLVISPELQARLAGATLAISDEPEGGSPTGAPTGPVLGAGVLAPV